MTALTDAQRLFFEAQGYLVIENALTDGELAAARRAADAAEARWRADESLPGVRRTDLEQVLGIMEYDPVLADLLEHPRIFPVVRELLGPDVMMLDHDYFISPPGATVSWAWHFDLELPGIFHSRSRLMIKVFYVLEDIPADGGATLVLPGSHRFRRLLIYNYGHKWMRIWQTYEPSAALIESFATTPMRRQLLGLTDPYGMENARWEEAGR